MNVSDLTRNSHMLSGRLAKRGYMRWFHSFSGVHAQTGETRTFFVEFFIMNPASGSDRPILGQHPFYKKRGIRPSYVMVKAGVFPSADGSDGRQLNAFYPVSALKVTKAPLVMEIGDCFYSENRIRGFVNVTAKEARHRSRMTDAGCLEWDLEVYKAVACHTGILASPLFQFLNALDSYWHGEGIKSFFKGKVVLDGEDYLVTPESSSGYADKHWGRAFNRPWMQFACGRLTSERLGRELKHSVLAVNGCCPRFLFLPLRHKLLIQLTYMGEDFRFGFSPFLLSRCKWETKKTDRRYIWHITARSKKAVIKISGSCTKAQMLSLKYESPDGILSKHPLRAGGSAIGTVQIFRRENGGRELIDTLHMEQGLCEYR